VALEPLDVAVLRARIARLRLTFDAEAPAYTLKVNSDHPRLLAASTKRCDRQACYIAQLAVCARAKRLVRSFSQLLEVYVLALSRFAQIALLGFALCGTKEEAVEDKLEDAPLIL
jgi:hypothetical protein